MMAGSERLEHLFTRYLDGECTPDEGALLEALVREDAQVRALFEDYRQLDRALGAALRQDMAHAPRTRAQPDVCPPRTVRIADLRLRVGKGLAVAAAACLAALAWLHPAQPPTPPGPARTPQQAASWFAPLPTQGDAVEPTAPAYERPELRLRGTQRNWIVIPGDRPGKYLVVEVDQVRTHVIGVHQDF